MSPLGTLRKHKTPHIKDTTNFISFLIIVLESLLHLFQSGCRLGPVSNTLLVVPTILTDLILPHLLW